MWKTYKHTSYVWCGADPVIQVSGRTESEDGSCIGNLRLERAFRVPEVDTISIDPGAKLGKVPLEGH